MEGQIYDTRSMESCLSTEITVSETEGLRWHGSRMATFCPVQRLFRCGLCSSTAFIARHMAEHWLGSHANFKAFQCPHCPYMSSWQRCVRMHLIRHHGDRDAEVAEFDDSSIMLTIQEHLGTLKKMCERRGVTARLNVAAAGGDTVREAVEEEHPSKRHHCPYCPYSTHRRDLYNRHENIHKSDKPFHCYVCKKMFNRADHVKKHFLRIHRDVPYDVKQIRRIPPKTMTAQVYYAKAPTMPAERPVDKKKLVVGPVGVYLPGDSADHGAEDQFNGVREIKQETMEVREDYEQQHSIVSTENGKLNILSLHQKFPMNKQQRASPSPESRAEEKILPVKDESAVDEDALGEQKENQKVQDSEKGLEVVTDDGIQPVQQRKDPEQRPGRRRQDCYACPQCPWRGFDNWCLKRHVNTHTKPYTCSLCTYKAARSERLTFHVAKVHGKRICVKCFFVCEDQPTLSQHLLNNHDNGQGRQGFTCLTCACTFRLHEELEAHMVSVHRRQVLVCSQCRFHTTDPAVFDDHVRYSHQVDEDPAPPPPTSSATTTSMMVMAPNSPVTGGSPVILNVPSVVAAPAAVSPENSSSSPPPQLQRPPAAPDCSHCRSVASQLLCVHRGQALLCQARGCSFQTSSADHLQQHALAEHDDQIVRCPHCAFPLHSALEFSLHWPLHHPTLCWGCALLIQRHCALVEAGVDPAVEGQFQHHNQLPMDYSAFLSLQMTTEEVYSPSQQSHEDVEGALSGLSDDDGIDKETLKRSRKQSRPKRLLSDSDEPVPIRVRADCG